MQDTDYKYQTLLEILTSLGNLAVAFSGGADSALLLYAAKEALGAEQALRDMGFGSCVSGCMADWPESRWNRVRSHALQSRSPEIGLWRCADRQDLTM